MGIVSQIRWNIYPEAQEKVSNLLFNIGPTTTDKVKATSKFIASAGAIVALTQVTQLPTIVVAVLFPVRYSYVALFASEEAPKGYVDGQAEKVRIDNFGRLTYSRGKEQKWEIPMLAIFTGSLMGNVLSVGGAFISRSRAGYGWFGANRILMVSRLLTLYQIGLLAFSGIPLLLLAGTNTRNKFTPPPAST